MQNTLQKTRTTIGKTGAYAILVILTPASQFIVTIPGIITIGSLSPIKNPETIIMLKKLLLILPMALASLTIAHAGDIWFIAKPNSLITASHDALATFMALNDGYHHTATRSLYRALNNQGALFNLQPGARVEVVTYYGDGIARIEWGNGRYTGFIAKDDLSAYLGSTD
jgi:hypothetical protein